MSRELINKVFPIYDESTFGRVIGTKGGIKYYEKALTDDDLKDIRRILDESVPKLTRGSPPNARLLFDYLLPQDGINKPITKKTD